MTSSCVLHARPRHIPSVPAAFVRSGCWIETVDWLAVTTNVCLCAFQGWEVQEQGTGRCGGAWVPASWFTGYHVFAVSSHGRGRGELSSISFVNGTNLIDGVLHPSDPIQKGFSFKIWLLRVHKTVYSSSASLLLQIHVWNSWKYECTCSGKGESRP